MTRHDVVWSLIRILVILVVVAMALPAGAANNFTGAESSGLIARWHFEDTANDSSTKAQHLTLTGGCSYNATYYYDGSKSVYIDLGGGTDYAYRATGDLASDFPGKASSPVTVTMSVWFDALPSSGNLQVLAAVYNPAAGGRSWGTELWNDSGTYRFTMRKGYNSGDNWERPGTSAQGLAVSAVVNTQYRVAFRTDQSGNCKIWCKTGSTTTYTDTFQTATGDLVTTTEPFRIGAWADSGSGADAYFDEVTLWKVALSDADVQAILDGNYPPSAAKPGGIMQSGVFGGTLK